MKANEVEIILERITDINQYGISFLISFGITWIICGLFWKKASEKTAGYATLFQGMIALPIALLGSYFMGGLTESPGGTIFSQLIMTMAMSQLLILPLIIVMQAKKQYTLVPFVFSASLTIHFVLYSWLYQTWLYIVLSIAIAVGVAIIYSVDDNKKSVLPSIKAAARCCFLTGSILLGTSIVFLFF